MMIVLLGVSIVSCNPSKSSNDVTNDVVEDSVMVDSIVADSVVVDTIGVGE